jgi:hypothetical protein
MKYEAKGEKLIAHMEGPDRKDTNTLCGLQVEDAAGDQGVEECPACKAAWEALTNTVDHFLNENVKDLLDQAKELHAQANHLEYAAATLVKRAQTQDWPDLSHVIGSDAADVFCMTSPTKILAGWDLKKMAVV